MKKAIAWLVSLALLAGAVLGGVFFYQKSAAEKRTVEVVPVSYIYTTYWGDETQSEGMVSTGMTQTVLPSDDQIIQEIYVTEGQEVSVGTPLLQYDTTLLQLELELKELSLQSYDAKIANAEQQLKELKQLKPRPAAGTSFSGFLLMTADTTADPDASSSEETSASEPTSASPSDPSDPNESPSARESTDPEIPERKKLISGEDLTGDAPYTGEGTEENPRIYLCDFSAEVTPAFVAYLIQERAAAEVHYYLNEDAANQEEPVPSYKLTLDGAGIYQILNPEPEPEPDPEEPTEPTEPDFPIEPEIPAEPDYIPYTRDEIRKMIADKEDEIVRLKLDKRSSELNLKTSRRKLENATVLSTVNGVVKSVKDLDTAKLEGSPLIEVTASGGCYVTGCVSELMLEQISNGDSVSLMSYETGMIYMATITSVSDVPSDSRMYFGGSENPNVSYYDFTAAVEEGEALRSGEYVGITISSPDPEAGEGLYIEKPYVRTENGESYVYKVDENGLLKKQTVQTGKTLWDYYVEVKSGLSLADYVAFPYGKNVRDGVKAVTADGETPVIGAEDLADDLFDDPEADFDDEIIKE